MTGVQKDALSGRLGRRDTVAFSDVGSAPIPLKKSPVD
jgi:hypothetical protein